MPTLKYRDPNTGEYVPVPGGSGGGETFAGSVPIGTVTSYAGSTAPDGWHLCDGSAHGSTELEAIIGSPNAPDLRDRFILGAGPLHAAATTGGEEAQRSLTDLAREEPDAFALVVVNLIMVHGMEPAEPMNQES